MSSQTRNQEYKYQYKTVAVANGFFCGIGPGISVSVPENLLDIKSIFLHAVFRFDVSVPIVDRKILWAGVNYPTVPYTYGGFVTSIPDPKNGNMVEVNVPADPATRIADLRLDITHLKDAILEELSNNTFGFDQPFIQLKIITDMTGFNNISGDIVLWKIDFAYTTTGIQ